LAFLDTQVIDRPRRKRGKKGKENEENPDLNNEKTVGVQCIKQYVSSCVDLWKWQKTVSYWSDIA
jgi:hypothetical protein